MSLLSGHRLEGFPPIAEVMAACDRCSMDFCEILKSQSMDLWADAASCVDGLLQDPFWSTAIASGIAKSSLQETEFECESKVMVLSSWGEQGAQVCSPFNLERICMSFPSLKVFSLKKNGCENMGIQLSASCMNLLMSIFFVATNGGSTPIWITKENLMALVALVLSHYQCYFVPATGDPQRGNILGNPEVNAILARGMGMRVDLERKRGGESSSSRYLELAARCFENSLTKTSLLSDANNVQERDKCLLQMSTSLMHTAGLNLQRPPVPTPSGVTAHPQPQPDPVVTSQPSLLGARERSPVSSRGRFPVVLPLSVISPRSHPGRVERRDLEDEEEEVMF
ncbi:hypothetical protein ACH8ZP_01980 [Chlamydia pneumoniae]|uniref:Uncharacterized protein n=2 Tax=Chlamydia pneumoniae TaxID=83558 RepID=Q9Z8D9_CHLPN|nr:hypothetical protein [Chlamydia pneumoniae]AAD18548.1 hypothetical protein CPn_0404 [Chlamydia pneumoniae CWL029]AAF38203.1 hypothetical protein CP_0351 [Chlamydia pneumoniae AR39]CRI32906.1 Uncharacterized protein BN1224_Wien1_A_04130 [Chlamydia pneumoniae]CRI35769.1 Uncharacterized protein BN1224_CM1_A_04160 [Chlamydia pneumoniae]CRI36896.1 Uncharacterized protein BN1224_CV14_A_04150 [Chlamydia pneumoniae]